MQMCVFSDGTLPSGLKLAEHAPTSANGRSPGGSASAF